MFDIPGTTDAIRTQKQQLAELIAQIPENTDLAGNPLVGALIQGKNGFTRDPALYAKIFLEAESIHLEGPNPSPERKITFWIEQINGMRRQSGQWKTKPIVDLIQDALKLVVEVSDTTRRQRLLSLANYNGALLYRMVGRYEDAASALIMSAGFDTFACNPRGAAISLFTAQQERFCGAFGRGVSEEHTTRAFDGVWQAYLAFAEQMDANWRDAQGPLHLVVDAFVAKQKLPNRGELIARLNSSETADITWRDTINGPIVAFDEERWQDVIDTADRNIAAHGDKSSSSIADAILTNMLAKGRAQIQLGQIDEAITTFEEAIKYDRNHGGQWVKAAIYVEEYVIKSAQPAHL